MTTFSDRVHRVKPSFTLEMTSRAAELRAQGVDVINFSAGQPDFNTPENIRNAAKAAMDNDIQLKVLDAVKIANEDQKNFAANKVLRYFDNLQGKLRLHL